MDFLVFGIPGAMAVALIVEAAKRLWPVLAEPKWAILTAIGLGLLLSAGVQVAGQSPLFATWFEVVIGGLFAALAAMGIYDTAHKTR